jgi:FkbM family methyltransferase
MCESIQEYGRAVTMFSKEPGTLEWIDSSLRPGDVFYDIGANVGIYTIPAASQVGPEGAVYAFEPHVANCKSLLENVSRNGLKGRVKVISCALHNATGFFDFNYRDWTQGSSMSQLEGHLDPYGEELRLVGTELKFATTLDRLVEQATILPPTAVKMDVDGNELLILEGMRGILTGDSPPRSIQIEANPEDQDALLGVMDAFGFELTSRHYTALGAQALEEGRAPELIAYNGIFSPKRRGGVDR